MLKIYNSLTRQKEIFSPLESKKVKMYVCGVTVYDYCHIGHARTYVAFDVVIRYLQWRNYEVEYVRNITDIDDKIINRANESNQNWQILVDHFTQAMYEDFDALGLLRPSQDPRATDFIPQMIELVQKLIANGYAYIASNGDVYYDVRRFNKYGCLAHRDLDELESGARIEISDVKKDPLDFVLWKKAKPNEPYWDSPWGEGRPGWHLECSAMSANLLGNHFDIHGGGKDLIFPHHENEIAQSEGANQTQFVNTWMHTGFLQINKEKMSKSLGNFLTIKDILKNHDPETLRYFLMTSHYRSQLSFSEDSLHQAHNSLLRFYNALLGLPLVDPITDSDFEKNFIEAMDDDFNTPIAFSVLFEIAHEIQRLKEKDLQRAAQYGALLKKLGNVLGFLQQDPEHFMKSISNPEDLEKIEKLIHARTQARFQKNWAESDRIRDELMSMNISLEDKPEGTVWKVK